MKLINTNKLSGAAAPLQAPAPSAFRRAFTLIELLVVMVIIAIIAALAGPSLVGLRDGDTMSAACRQVVDDIGIARLRALNERTRMFVVFFPSIDRVTNSTTFAQLYNPLTMVADYNLLVTNTLANELLPAQCRSYAIFSLRSLGDQPGRTDPKFLTGWQTLPDRTYFIPEGFFTNKFRLGDMDFPFPDETSPHRYYLPYLEITPLGQLATTNNQDIAIQIAQGSIQIEKSAPGAIYNVQVIDIMEQPAGNSVNNPNFVVINWLTARGKVQRLELESQ